MRLNLPFKLSEHIPLYLHTKREREEGGGGLHRSEAGVKEVFQGITMFPAKPKNVHDNAPHLETLNVFL